MALTKKEPRSKFYELLQAQIHNEFHASQQYIALAVWFDNEDLPQLAKHFYKQSVEERNHAMALVQYMLDRDHHVEVPGVKDVRNEFSAPLELLELALEQEKEVAADVSALAKAARAEEDYISEQFTQWFLKEQVEEISQMSTLVTVARRAGDNVYEIEKFLHREAVGTASAYAGMPPVAGGAL